MKKKNQPLTPVEGRNIELKGFWGDRLGVFREVTIGDVLTKFEQDRSVFRNDVWGFVAEQLDDFAFSDTASGESGAFSNFVRVKNGESGMHIGPPWYDGLIGECIRGIADFLACAPNPEIEARIDGYIDLIAAAQDADTNSFLDTYTTLICPDHRWGEDGGNLLWQHDLYNIGCIVEGGIHYYRATGKTKLLTVAVRVANYVCSEMGPAPKKNIVPAHSLPEEAYLKLYSLFAEQPELKQKIDAPVREQDYLDLVKFWLDMRGVHEGRSSYPRYMGEYSVDHRPLIEQSEAVGHSVRAALLYAGMAEYVNITGDAQYAAACRRIWENIVQRKMHISGGIGAIHSEEKFGYEYQLPNGAYLETCASVALVFFARNMFLREGKAEYIDVMERALYNGILPGISLGGDEYFYRNPLMSKGDEKRWAWHECPCCPPMFLKVMGELPSYIYATDAGGVYVNLYAASEASIDLPGGALKIAQETAFPWDGKVKLTMQAAPDGAFMLRLRIPEYATGFAVSVNGEAMNPAPINGYIAINRVWKAGDVVSLDLQMAPTAMAAHPYVHEDNDMIALQYGPLLYCVEEADNDMTDIVLPKNATLSACASKDFPGVVDICFEDTKKRSVRALPYYLWANRKIGKMQVWLDAEDWHVPEAKEWGTALYRPYK